MYGKRLMKARRTNSRDRILAAAADVARETGPGSLSLDAVASRAGVSKGGLLYNFPTKAKLMQALVEEYLRAFEQAPGVRPHGRRQRRKPACDLHQAFGRTCRGIETVGFLDIFGDRRGSRFPDTDKIVQAAGFRAAQGRDAGPQGAAGLLPRHRRTSQHEPLRLGRPFTGRTPVAGIVLA